MEFYQLYCCFSHSFPQGVVGVLLDYVVKFSASLDSDQDELITMSCKALIRVARGNKDVRTVY